MAQPHGVFRWHTLTGADVFVWFSITTDVSTTACAGQRGNKNRNVKHNPADARTLRDGDRRRRGLTRLWTEAALADDSNRHTHRAIATAAAVAAVVGFRLRPSTGRDTVAGLSAAQVLLVVVVLFLAMIVSIDDDSAVAVMVDAVMLGTRCERRARN